MPESVRIVEVGPRDGLQNEKIAVPVAARIELINRLAAAGLRSIEVGSFVSPKRIPQMLGTDEVVRQLPVDGEVRYPVLVPNQQGMAAALDAGAREVAIFASASETFSAKNINCSIAESIERFGPVVDMAKANGVAVRGYVSCVLGCPYEGAVATGAVVSLSRRLADLGCYEVSLGDTIGIGTPRQARQVIHAVAQEIGAGAVALHFHDTRGQALANILACLEEGVTVIDSAVAGLGGCPYAPGASGNVSTEDLLFMLHGMGVTTGVDLGALVEAGRFISAALGRATGSKVAQAMIAGGASVPAM
ncbi:hydroxymethylglutaryl-CoA lyase [Mesorhizobium australicum]|uniref:hydroxymethylglutaryl-CoA lyase n=1 Tax=Mesorhizobium australicum TaxID=536018 RepID=A0A1X7P8B1_9HYPH|nr:hydroxymethylglutaryl-CoA lyase [Mesorhizobium australicum]SMH47224.1 hydroxymethylglutaryl-CoA lyase [Mesorhizobium australicum]